MINLEIHNRFEECMESDRHRHAFSSSTESENACRTATAIYPSSITSHQLPVIYTQGYVL
jgi:hypothetical protein